MLGEIRFVYDARLSHIYFRRSLILILFLTVNGVGTFR